MKIMPLSIAGAYHIVPEKRGDNRGAFARLFCTDRFDAAGLNTKWVQMNLSRSSQQGTVRGLHFQRPPFSEIKLVRAVTGRVYDVVVDLREGSKTYGAHCGVTLDSDQMDTLYIPQGCAHGFQTLTDNVELHYMHSAPYAPDHEDGVRFDDPTLAIRWPLSVTETSPRDRALPLLSDMKPLIL
ncbi:dTDP-4-dehydrorhamnose 3,5-epimerase [Pseudophaeobacter arcticus]|jgi:dTDP-4-dehydrorhamnose 3,5-epimerase|uniref:dTDP-4-dehydrorhamnose 3,5-epimerase n=1 Tax=Pseudophaeobacter arcticus TaxID=385492 RepID=UPI00047F3589|nr:dTDP-4-dehydrorhamnose 3,5-epimerase [Pseudophaeobacter arcticus]